MSETDASKIEVDVELESQDVLRASYWSFFRNWTTRILIFFAISLLIGFVFVFVANPNAAMLGVLVLPAIVLFLILNVYFGVKRNWAKNDSLRQNVKYTFTNDGVDLETSDSSAKTAWKNFSNVCETKHNFLLFVSQNMFIVPKRVFRNVEQIEALRQMLETNLGSKAKLRE